MPDQNSSSEIMVWFKLVVFALPVSVLPFIKPVNSHAQFGIALIVGALLQALIPPRRKGLVPILIGSVAFAIIYSLF
jgi:hypothetical protein